MVQVEQIFRDIENMCFLRTGEGFKSVMKAELTVVEAIMQASGIDASTASRASAERRRLYLNVTKEQRQQQSAVYVVGREHKAA